uniref:Uncharacterized protein n=1 Tax=Gossypium raimondii TaxID=29730 RepID=A0A0D2RKS7_GOSRA|nr:hypothetical protein B456_003G116800 [Gossypium raimondii]
MYFISLIHGSHFVGCQFALHRVVCMPLSLGRQLFLTFICWRLVGKRKQLCHLDDLDVSVRYRCVRYR